MRNRTRQAVGLQEELLTIVKRQKFRWYGHVSRSSGLAKTVLQGTLPGGRKRSRHRKRWEDNIPEWAGLNLCDAVKESEEEKDRGNGSPGHRLVSQWSSQLRDRCRYRYITKGSSLITTKSEKLQLIVLD